MNKASWYEVDFVHEMNRAVTNLSILGKKLVPAAAASSANKMARAIRTATIKQAAKQLRVPEPILKYHESKSKSNKRSQRFRLKLATTNNPEAQVRMGRTGIPAVRLIKNPAGLDTRLARVRRKKSIKAGQHVFQGVFVAAGVTKHAKGVLKGRYQVMRRTGTSRYPLEVVKIQTKTAITRHAIRETRAQLRNNAGNYLATELLKQTKTGLLKR